MSTLPQNSGTVLPRESLSRIVFVLGKGGVGRSTVAAALGLALAQRGERVLVLGWAPADPIAPWFGQAAAGATPLEVCPHLWAANYAMENALRGYFVDHLHLGLLYRTVIHSHWVWQVLQVAPGISELFFLGQLWWLTHLAAKEAGLRFDRIVVDAPATGHGTSLLDIPATLASMGSAGVLAHETRRVVEMLKDPQQLGAVVVALPEPLVVDETLELVPHLTAQLGRRPLGVLINRSAVGLADAVDHPAWLDSSARLPPESRGVLQTLHTELRTRERVESELLAKLVELTANGCASLPEQLGLTPADVVRALARLLDAQLGAR